MLPALWISTTFEHSNFKQTLFLQTEQEILSKSDPDHYLVPLVVVGFSGYLAVFWTFSFLTFEKYCSLSLTGIY